MNKVEKEKRRQEAAYIAFEILARIPLKKCEPHDSGVSDDDLMDWLLWILDDDFPYEERALEKRLIEWVSNMNHHDHLLYTDSQCPYT